MKLLYNNKNFILSLSIKILFLFLFLSCFFYIIVEKQVKSHLSDNISNLLYDFYNDKINIEYRDLYDNYFSDININSKLEEKTIKYNKLLFILNIAIIIFLTIIPVIIYYIYKYIYNENIPLMQIILFNLILYLIVGIIEYIFFIEIASKYIPITNGDIINVIKNYFLK